MGKLLIMAGLAFVLYSRLRGESYKRALYPIAWCVGGYYLLRYGVTSLSRFKVWICLAGLLLPWIVAPYIPRLRDRLRAARRVPAPRRLPPRA